MLTWNSEIQKIEECGTGKIYWVRVLASNPHFFLIKKVEEINPSGEKEILAEFIGEIEFGKPSIGPSYRVDGTLFVFNTLSVKLGQCGKE